MFFFFKRYLFLQPCASFACFVFVLKLKSQTRSSEGAFPRSGKKLDVVTWEDWFCFLEPGPALGQVYGVWRWCASRRGPPSTSSPSSSTQPEMLPMLHHPDQLFKVYCLVTNCYFLFNFFFQQARGWINILQVSGRTTFVMSACAVERIFLRSSVPQQLFSLSLLFFLFVFTILLFAVQKHIYCSYLNCVTSSKGFFCTSLSCFIVSLAIRGGDFHYKATHAIHAIGSDRIASKEMGKIRRINHFVTGLGGNTNHPNWKEGSYFCSHLQLRVSPLTIMILDLKGW